METRDAAECQRARAPRRTFPSVPLHRRPLLLGGRRSVPRRNRPQPAVAAARSPAASRRGVTTAARWLLRLPAGWNANVSRNVRPGLSRTAVNVVSVGAVAEGEDRGAEQI